MKKKVLVVLLLFVFVLGAGVQARTEKSVPESIALLESRVEELEKIVASIEVGDECTSCDGIKDIVLLFHVFNR